jgi:hypothetical protein
MDDALKALVGLYRGNELLNKRVLDNLIGSFASVGEQGRQGVIRKRRY